MRSKKRNRKSRKKPKKHKRHFSLAFLIAIPGNFVLACLCLIAFISLFQYTLIDEKTWAVFATGVIGALAIVGGAKMSRFRVFIHELKHALVVILTGNSLKNFVVGKETGHVNFEMYEDKVHFAPIIALAPYFFPLFSLPVLILCIFLENSHNLILSFFLGASFATDLSMAYTDLHPHQSDLQKIPGGVFAGLLYLAGAHFLWLMITLLWVTAGRDSYIYMGYVVAEIATQIAANKGM